MEPWNKPDRPDVIHEFITLCKVRAGGFMPRKSIDRYLGMVIINKAGLDYDYDYFYKLSDSLPLYKLGKVSLFLQKFTICSLFYDPTVVKNKYPVTVFDR